MCQEAACVHPPESFPGPVVAHGGGESSDVTEGTSGTGVQAPGGIPRTQRKPLPD